jgi:hypothetical protein
LTDEQIKERAEEHRVKFQEERKSEFQEEILPSVTVVEPERVSAVEDIIVDDTVTEDSEPRAST